MDITILAMIGTTILGGHKNPKSLPEIIQHPKHGKQRVKIPCTLHLNLKWNEKGIEQSKDGR